MKTTKAIAKGILLGAAAIALATLLSCQPLPAEANPLDVPGTGEPTAAELHQGNLEEITSNPAYQPR